MDIKEIALKVARNMAWALEVPSLRVKAETIEHFAEALIESYKAELLNEVGEPVGLFDVYNGDSYIQIKPEYSDETTVKLYTFDQVAAAILKVTKPLKEEVARYRGKSIADADRTEAYLYENQELRAQLAVAQEQLAIRTQEFDAAWRRLAKAEQRVVRQYYFKNNSCKAESSHDPDCICWHDEGTGPMQPLLDGTYLVPMTWRKFVKEV